MSALEAGDRAALLQIARAAVEAELRCQSAFALPADLPGRLQEHAGAFVSLHAAEGLRGCIGYVEPRWPLAETVARAAGAAATRDRRFAPLLAAELVALQVEVSVLSAAVPVIAAQIEIGVHGLILECAQRCGLLLPQVPLLYGWDVETYLEHLCGKAGLPAGSWRRDDARLLAFTAHVFSEPAAD